MCMCLSVYLSVSLNVDTSADIRRHFGGGVWIWFSLSTCWDRVSLAVSYSVDSRPTNFWKILLFLPLILPKECWDCQCVSSYLTFCAFQGSNSDFQASAAKIFTHWATSTSPRILFLLQTSFIDTMFPSLFSAPLWIGFESSDLNFCPLWRKYLGFLGLFLVTHITPPWNTVSTFVSQHLRFMLDNMHRQQ